MATIGVYELLVTVKYISELEHSAPGLFGRLTALPSKLQLLLIKMDIAHRKMWPEAGRRPAAAYMICLTRELPGDVRIRRKGGPLGEWGQRLVGGRAPNGNSRWGTCKNIDLFEQVWAALPDAEKAQFEIPELLSFVSAIERDCVDNHVERQNQLFISIKYWLQLKVRTAEKFGTLHQILSDNLFCVTLGLGPYGGAGHDDLIRLFVPPIQALVDEHLAGHRPDVERLEQVVHRIWWLLVYHYDLAQSVHIAPLVTLSQWYPSTHLIPLSSMLAAIDRLTNKKRDPEVVVLYETFLTTVAKPAIESIAQGEAEGTVYGELQTVIEMDAKYGISDDETFAAVIAVAKKAIFDLQDDNYMPNSRWPRVRECIARLAPAIAMRDPALLLDWCDEKLLALFDGLQPNSVLRGKIAQAMMACHASLGEE